LIVAGARTRAVMSRRWHPTATGWSESTLAEQAWVATRHAATRWALWGAALGLLLGLVLFAPAAWLASALQSASDERLLLADARGTVWSGSAIVVLTGGPGSRDATTLPGRLQWQLGWRGRGPELRLSQACCLNGTIPVALQPGFGRFGAILAAPPGGWIGQWPASLLGGLGTPWNTLQLGGTVRAVSPGLTIEWVQGRWRVGGRLDVELNAVSSRLAPIDPLGSYRLTIAGDAANPGVSQLTLTTVDGALQLSGSGSWGPAGVRFRGEAGAAAGNEAALNNLLNIIGRRSGARSVISIG
jgi:general secretion pathway protein N